MCLMNANVPIDSIRCQIIEALDIMVHLVRLPDGRRVVYEIDELLGYEEGKYVLNPLYSFDMQKDRETVPGRIRNREKLRQRGCENERFI